MNCNFLISICIFNLYLMLINWAGNTQAPIINSFYPLNARLMQRKPVGIPVELWLSFYFSIFTRVYSKVLLPTWIIMWKYNISYMNWFNGAFNRLLSKKLWYFGKIFVFTVSKNWFSCHIEGYYINGNLKDNYVWLSSFTNAFVNLYKYLSNFSHT